MSDKLTSLALIACLATAIPAYAIIDKMGTYQVIVAQEDDCPEMYGAYELRSVTRDESINMVVCTYKGVVSGRI